ncbi:histidine phosphatase family protein [Ornithinimicrobium ciconiae]|uniref:histidine phosphatase family protein n=1 Tax=Ornithinimicrobium ciconiae TaxID=2594265 RepID=UPI001D188E34|nr:histidine phosphatase family protein [Ornithinimicrobium ciconiae]
MRTEPVRRLIVWRHGETEHNVGGIWQGQLDTDLSARGEQQAAAAAAALSGLGPTRIVSSDLRRAAHTARVLGEVTGLPMEYDERFREIHVGTWQGMTQGDVAAQYPDAVDALSRGEDIVRGDDGESVAHVEERVLAAAQELITDLPDDGALVVATHGVAGRALVAALIGLPQRQAWLSMGGLRNCHWAELAEHRTGWRMLTWNVGVTDSVISTSDR